MPTIESKNIPMSQQDLINLINLAKSESKPERPHMFTWCYYAKYLNQTTMHSESLDTMNRRIFQFSESFPKLPSEPLPINTWIANLTRKNGLPMAYESKKSYLNSIITLLNFVIKNFDFPDYTSKLKTPSDKQSNLQKLDQRTFWTKEQIFWILNEIPEGQYKLLCLTLSESDARIGEFGITPEHDCLRASRIHPEIEQIEVYGKTGYHRKHCSSYLCELLIQNANPENGAIFYSKVYPDGTPSIQLRKNLWKILNKIIRTGCNQGIFDKVDKTGAHTFRHSVATFIADVFNSADLVQQFLSHSDSKTSKLYTHLTEERKAKLPSPLKLMGMEIAKHNKQNNNQPLLITEGTEVTTTALSIPGQEPIEQVEGIPDLTEEMFPKIPEENKRVHLTFKELESIRKVAIYYTKKAPQLDPIPGILSRMFSHIYRKNK